MIALDTPDTRADIQAWRAAGLETYEPYDFSRMAKMPDGTDVRVGFSVAIVSSPSAPWLGLFACQHYRPDYYEQPQYMKHSNHATTVRDVWVAGDAAPDLADFIGVVTGASRREETDRTVFQTRTGAIILARPRAFEAAFGIPAPHPEDGPHLAALTVGCSDFRAVKDRGLPETGGRYVLSPQDNFGTAIAFVADKVTLKA
jgi:hypothetical protein